MRLVLFLLTWVFAPVLRRRAVLAAAQEHDAYAQERVHARKRLGFDADQRVTAIAQRARRKLYWLGVRVSVEQVRRILHA